MKNKLLVSLNVLLLVSGCAGLQRPGIKKHSQNKGDNKQNKNNKGKPLPNSTLDTFIKTDKIISETNAKNDKVVYNSVSRLLQKDKKTGKLTKNSELIKYKAEKLILKQAQADELKRLIDDYTIDNANNNNKKEAVISFLKEMYGRNAPDNLNTTDDYEKFYKDNVAKKHNIADRHTNIGEFFDIYNNGKYEDGGAKSYTGGYTKAVRDLDALKNIKLPEKISDNFPNQQDYVKYLKTLPENKSIVATTADEFINKAHEQYVNKYKTFIGKQSGETCSYDELRTGLENKTNVQKDIVNKIGENLLKKYKENINPNYKGTELPTALKAIIEELKDEDKILKAIVESGAYKSFMLLPKLEKGLSISTNSFMDDSPGDVAEYKYDAETNNYTLKLKETATGSAGNKTDDEVKFNVSDFRYKQSDKNDKYGYYEASKLRSSTSEEKAYTFMKNVKEYIINSAGFDNTLEQEARRNKLKLALEKVRRGNASDEEKEFVKKIIGDDIDSSSYGVVDWTAIDYSQLTDKDKKKLNFLLDVILKNKITSFDVYKQKEIVDTVKLGGRALGLSYSDFGIWKIKGGFHFIGNKDLITKAKEWGEDLDDKSYEDYYTFTNGIDKYKQGFDTAKATVGAKTKFTGTTMAVATLTDSSNKKKHKEFNGTASMTVDNASGKAEVGLEYKNWYNFKFKEIDVKNSNGFSSNVAPEINGTSADSEFKFNNLTGQTGEIKGKMYGLEAGKPEEAVGSFKVNSAPADPAYNNLTVNGVFGVKN